VIGESLALASAVAFAFANIAIARGSRDAEGESAVVLAVIATALFSGIGFLLVGPAGPQGASKVGWVAVGWFAVSGMLATVAGRLTLFKSIQYAGVVRASTVRRIAPVFSLLLAWGILGELISPTAGVGMALIVGSFALLWLDSREKLEDTRAPIDVTRGLAFGTASAGLYDPFLGALIGAATGALWYAVRSATNPGQRRMVLTTLARPNPWQAVAAICISLGQLMQFAALTHIGVARVTFLNSMEVYVSALLAVFVFRTEPMPSRAVLAATALATGGVIFVALG
jgi:drug/metabolite transporter (DMT)-like permease